MAKGSDAETYSVSAGDTLRRIAARFGVSVPDLLDANSLPIDSVIRPGQRLTIPSGAVGGPTTGSSGSTQAAVVSGSPRESEPQSRSRQVMSKPSRRATSSRQRMAAGTTSQPMPSPGMESIV